MAFGLACAADGTLYFGEYATESGDRSTGVWRSRDAGEYWELAFEFEPGQVRHIHAVHCGPRRRSVDWHRRPRRALLRRPFDDGGSTFEWVGHGAHIYRTCAFVGFEDVVLWSTDADFEQNHVVRWHRATGAVTVDAELPDVTYYATPCRRRARPAGARAGGRAGLGRAPAMGMPSRGSTGRSAARHPGGARLPACDSRGGQPRRGIRAREPAADDRLTRRRSSGSRERMCPGERGRERELEKAERGTGSIARDAGLNLGARLFAMACSSVTALVVAGALARSEYGAYAIAFGIGAVLVMGLDLGLTSSVARFRRAGPGGHAPGRGRRAAAPRDHRSRRAADPRSALRRRRQPRWLT